MSRPTVVAMLVLVASMSTASAAERTVRIGTVAGQLGNIAAESYQPFTDHLTTRIPGTRFEMVLLATIDDMVRAVDAGQIEFALATPAALVTLSTRHDIRTLATVTQAAGEVAYPWLAGAVFTRSQADAHTLADMRGRRVIALSPLALGGWLAAVREWRALGLDERRDPASVEFLFSYANLAAQVCAGHADIGVLPAAMFQTVAGICPGGFRVLPRSDGVSDRRYPIAVSTRLYPEAGFVAVTETDERLVARLTEELLAIEPGSAVAQAATVAGFTAPLSYTPVRELMEELRVPPFETYGQLTLGEALRQHSGKASLALLLFSSALALAFLRTKRLNRQLKRSDAFRERVFENSHLPIVVMDGETFTYLDCNAAAAAIYRFASREETLAKTPFDVSAPTQYDGLRTPEYLLEHFERARTEGQGVFEWRHQRPDGEIWDADVHLMTFTSDNRRLMQFTLEDVTAQKRTAAEAARLERQLELSQRMDSIGRLAGAVAHDFNNLLTVINGYTELATAELPSTSPVRENLDHIARAGTRAAELTQQLLTFSKKRIGQPIPLDLNDVVGELTGMFKRLLPEDVHLDISKAGTPCLVLADASQMQQVLINLVVNARDAMPRGGTLSIAVVPAHVTPDVASPIAGTEPGDYIALTVGDTGIGMDAEIQKHIFEPFFSTKGESGNGLGLATVYGIVRQLRGTIAVASAPGEGTTFTLHLPTTARHSHPEPVVPRRPPAPAGPRTVLIVEDEDDVRGFARRVLTNAGYHVIEASNADDALALAGAEHVDVLLTDVVLRGMNGYALSQAFMARQPAAAVLFVSGYADDELAQRGLQQGDVAFLPKPYSSEQLLLRIAEL